MVTLVGIQNAEIYGLGIVAIFIIVWFFSKSLKNQGRMGIEGEVYKEGQESLHLSQDIRRHQKNEKFKATELYKLFLDLTKRAESIGLQDVLASRYRYIEFIRKGLNKLISADNIGADTEKIIIVQINNAINLFLVNFPSQDKEVSDIISRIRLVQKDIYGEITEEIEELHKREGELKSELEQTERELGTLAA